MVASLLVPILTTLATKGLDLIGSAILAKGKDVVEKELGVQIDEQSLQDPELVAQFQIKQMEHEEKLIEMAVEDKKIDLEYYKQDTIDRNSARQREVSLFEHDADWFNRSIASVLALVTIIGGGLFLYFSTDADIKYGVIALMGTTLQYYFGSSKTSAQKDVAINNLSRSK